MIVLPMHRSAATRLAHHTVLVYDVSEKSTLVTKQCFFSRNEVCRFTVALDSEFL